RTPEPRDRARAAVLTGPVCCAGGTATCAGSAGLVAHLAGAAASGTVVKPPRRRAARRDAGVRVSDARSPSPAAGGRGRRGGGATRRAVLDAGIAGDGPLLPRGAAQRRG